MPELKRGLDTNASCSTPKRIRRQSGVVSLQELRQSLKFEDISDPSVKELQRQGSAIAKLQLLYRWEQSAARSIVRVSFHSGYIINKLLLSQPDLKLQDIGQQSNIGIYTFKRNRQLFQQLGKFRTILYTTVPISRLYSSITAIKKELDESSPEEQEYWSNPPKKLVKDPACFVKVYMKWFDDQPPIRVFYELDLFDNKLNNGVDDMLLKEICTNIATVEDHHMLNNVDFWRAFKDGRYVLVYWPTRDSEGHAAIIERNTEGTYTTSDEITIQDMWCCTKIITFK